MAVVTGEGLQKSLQKMQIQVQAEDASNSWKAL